MAEEMSKDISVQSSDNNGLSKGRTCRITSSFIFTRGTYD